MQDIEKYNLFIIVQDPEKFVFDKHTAIFSDNKWC